MAAVRPCVTVYSAEDADRVGSVGAPAVFAAPLRPDLVDFITSQMQLNTRMAYGVATNAGYQTAAESWGTGRAVARIPRVPGGGTHRSGQGAFGNMCRGGGMFAPTKVWRKWHRKINVTQRRHAMTSAIAATGVPALVMARGHRVSQVCELPLVVSDDVQGTQKTKDAVAFLNRFGLSDDCDAVEKSKKIRAGRGKARNRRYVMKKGPLVVYSQDDGIVKAFRNIIGVETMNVDNLHLPSLAPGGHLGRLTVYTESAFKQLKSLYGNGRGPAALKKGYHMPKAVMTNCDLHRLINSDEIQSIVRPMKEGTKKRGIKYNPLKNAIAMDKLNPGATHRAVLRKKLSQKGSREYEVMKAQKKVRQDKYKKTKSIGKAFFKSMKGAYVPAAVEEVADEE